MFALSRARRIGLAAVAAAMLAGLGLAGPAPARAAPGRGQATRSVVWARHGMVCAAQPLAVQAGLEILKAGGSAADAAIAVDACLGLMEPTSCGLGGDLFAILWDPRQGRVVGLNASGRAPLALTAAQVPPDTDGTVPLYSPYSWTVPGCADGWFELHARYGRLPMSRVLAAAIRYAEEGFPLSPVIASDWEHSTRVFKDKPGFAEVFMPGGRAPREGELFRNPALARTLRLLAEGGRDAYYRGPIAAALVRYSKAHGGFFAPEDFARHRSTWDAPISTTYHGVRVWELPPNGQGLSALELLNILENFDLARMGRDSPDFWHVFTEAKKLAFADRARYFADPEFARVPVDSLLSKAYARRRAALIDMAHAALTDSAGEPAALNQGETTFLCAADDSGMMVSLIQSNYTGFGSGYVVPELGFGIQDRGGLFSLHRGHPNFLEPGKRPFHTIIPAFVTRDGRPLLAFGVMGGDMQPQGHAQVIVNLVDLGMNLQEAGDAPRFHHTGSTEPTGTVMRDGGVLHIEDGVPAAVLEELRRRGHVLAKEAVGAYGGYQAIWRDPATGVYAGATERRKDGCAAGY
ncbi:MAG TPA: gamma-glutamyltransferase family protein [Candidatus Saccharimonadales bacterium]|nr:gamma-glutamyltransferase family protein [Candidatus Saccharimonadales bacterium]